MANEKFHFHLNDIDKIYLQINIKKDINLDMEYMNNIEFIKLKSIKDKIFNSKKWDMNKKFSNDYELIHIPNKRNRIESIALYQPLSRSYFKMIEIIKEFDLININKEDNFVSCHLAEGPGGFMEACYNVSHQIGFKTYKYHGITLYSSNKDIPGWSKAFDFIRKDKNINISYGEDNTGNLYKSENIKYFRDVDVKDEKAHLVTADGGFDFSIDFNKQEQLSYRLIFCEIVTALSVQRIGGHFVCKLFDLYTNASIKLIYFICCFYKDIYLYKPLTSRPANSEKYLICKNFKGIDKTYINNLLDVIKIWDNTPENIFINDIFTGKIPDYFVKKIKEYNKKNSFNQIKNIEKTIDLINKQKNLEDLNLIIEKQIDCAIEWCKRYNQDINHRSSFIKNRN